MRKVRCCYNKHQGYLSTVKIGELSKDNLRRSFDGIEMDCQNNYCKPMPTQTKCKSTLLLHSHPFSPSFSSLHVTVITEWFILWFLASTESDPIPYLILFAVCGFYRNAIAYPESVSRKDCAGGRGYSTKTMDFSSSGSIAFPVTLSMITNLPEGHESFFEWMCLG